MQFDARAAKLLTAGQHFTITDCPGLRLEVSATRRAWIYRYKSPVDKRMRQVKIGEWPAMSPAAAQVAWEGLRTQRDAGTDLAAEKQSARTTARAEAVAVVERKRAAALTVGRVCDEYLVERVEKNRGEKGAKEVRRMFATMLGELADVPAATLTRSQAFDLISAYTHIPVQAAKLRCEMGAAWDYSLDAGRLPESAPNWWRLILRGQLRSKGRTVKGKSVGTKKRVLNDVELGAVIRWLPNFSRLVNDVLTLYLWTATRGAEITSIEKHEVTDEKDGLWWTVPKEKTKNFWREGAEELRVPLIGRAETIVRRRMAAATGSYLFPARGKSPYTEQKVIGVAVWMHMPDCESKPESVRARLPVAKWAPHDLRRTARTQLAALGVSDEVGEAIIGHMPDGIRGVYNLHRYDSERREWLTRLNVRLEELAAVAD
ncbi:MAG: integrase family protein [Pseudomonadota bacterium]